MRNPLVNTGKHIDKIIDTTPCKKHDADTGEACHIIIPGSSRLVRTLLGVCGGRVKRAGYNGKISPTSMSLRTSGGRTGPSPKS